MKSRTKCKIGENNGKEETIKCGSNFHLYKQNYKI